MRYFIIRGILIGGSLGVFYALAGFSDSLPRAFGVGMIGGALAGLTLAIRQRKKRDRPLAGRAATSPRPKPTRSLSFRLPPAPPQGVSSGFPSSTPLSLPPPSSIRGPISSAPSISSPLACGARASCC
ncbi:MAG: hypothetical protein V8Q84_05870 [Bilophila sp.]